MSQTTRKYRYSFRKGVARPLRRFHQYVLADGGAGADLSAAVIFSPSQDVRIRGVTILPDGSAAGVDGSNTSAWVVTDGTNTLVAKTYTTNFPADNVQDSLGTVDTTYAKIKAGGRVELAVTNGATANLPTVLVLVEYSLLDDELAAVVGSDFCVTKSAAAGHPTVSIAEGGGLEMALDATAEAQNLCVSFGDVLPFDIDDIVRVEFVGKTVAALDSTTSIAFGLASARNDAIDSIAYHALFRLIGSNDVYVESDDGTNDKDDIATGITLGATFKRFAIDMGTGVQSRESPALSLGGKGSVQFHGGNAYGSLRRVASGTLFDMSNYAGGLQLFAQVQKTSDTNADTFTLLEAEVEVKVPNA